MKNPTVFISYSWDNEAHKQWVLNLAEKLIADGVDVLLDRYELRLGKHLTSFIENAIAKADRVIIIFTPNYKLKADNRSGGVGYEYSIINTKLYSEITTQEKIVPVLRAGGVQSSIPDFMQQFIHLDLSDNDSFSKSYTELLREIYNEPEIKKPPVGKKPAFVAKEAPSTNKDAAGRWGELLKEKTQRELDAKLKEIEEKVRQIEQIGHKKNEMARRQLFAIAADLRDTEKGLQEELTRLKSDAARLIQAKELLALEELSREKKWQGLYTKLKEIEVQEGRIENIKQEKNKIIRSQRFEEAATLRDSEKRLQEELEALKVDVTKIVRTTDLELLIEVIKQKKSIAVNEMRFEEVAALSNEERMLEEVLNQMKHMAR